MAEPKKETVRIVLPARRDGSPVTSSPRETAMINLPPRPVPVPGKSSAVPPPPVVPAGLKPPGPMPGIPAAPKPPSVPAIPSIPKPPSAAGSLVPPVPPAAPSFPKPPSATIPPMAPKPPVVPPSTVPPSSPPARPAGPDSATMKLPTPPSSAPVPPVAPAPLQAEVKKETAKVPPSTPGAKVLPQATVQLQKKPDPSASKSVSTMSVVVPPGEGASGDLNPVIGIAALVLALASLAVQVWMFIS